MRIVAVGGDKRFRYAIDWLRSMGYDAHWSGEWPRDSIDAVLVQREEDIKGENAAICFVQRGTGDRRNAVYLEKDEEYLTENAYLTAEGAVQAAMGVTGVAMYGAKCLIIGYGRIGRALVQILRSMRAEVTVAVRPGKSADRAAQDGVRQVSVRDAASKLAEYAYVWNTVPEQVLDAEDLRRMDKRTGLFELASAPFGFDIEQARALDLWAEMLSGLPGKYCPVTAGAVLARAIERICMRKREE